MQTSIFFPYSWHIDEEETEVTSIRVYGLNDKNKNICLRIDDFNPFVYIELPPEKSWNLSNGQLLMNKINELLGNKKPISCKLAWKKKLYGAYLDNKKERKVFPYLYCTFSNRNDIKTLCYKLKHNLHIVGLGSLKFKVHETDADPILQLTCCRNIPTAGWIKFHGKEVPKYDKITLCEQEFKVKWQHVFPEERDGVAKPKIMGFDIEVNSTNPSAMPKAEKMGDKVFQISCVIARDGDNPDDYEKYLLTLGQPDQDIVGEDVLVQMFDTEAQLLEGFTTFIREENPNIIVGYNILGFDIPYMIARAKMNMCIYEFDKQGFHKFAHAKERIIKWSSSAYKNQEFEFLDAEGRVYVDLLPLVKRDFKFNNYKLKTISEYFIGETKDPLTAKGIFKCYRIGIKKDKNNEYSNISQRAMAIVGKYCVQDSILVVRLMEKLKTWVGLTEMATVCNVPIFTLYTQGQQIKVFSQLYKYCMYEDIVVEKDAYEVSENERYVGAKVFPPIPGRYKMVVPFDFASLYPTTIIAYNIDYHTWVPPGSDIPDSMCHVMEWSDHLGCEHDPKVIRKLHLNKYIDAEKEELKKLREKRNSIKDKLRKKEIMDEINTKNEELKPYIEERSELTKTITKHPMCAHRKYRFLKEPRGVLPTVIQNCLDARKHTRKVDMKKCKQEIERLNKDTEDNGTDNTQLINTQKTLLDVLDKRQLAFKVSANSVSAITPIPCKINDILVYRTIENISKGDWIAINEEQEISTPIDNLLVWSDKGFTKPKYVMRHPQEKPLKRILTHTGLVDCTEDHSLLRPNGQEVKPSELNIGDELMHKQYPLPKDTPLEPLFKTLSDEIIENYLLDGELEELAFVHGLFFAEGTCGTWGERIKCKSSWIIYNQDYHLLERALKILNKYEEANFEISPFYSSSKIYHLRAKVSVKTICDKYRKIFYDNRAYKIVPDYIMNATFKIRQAFFMGYYAGDGARKLSVGVVISNRGQIGTASLMYIANSLGYNVSISNYKQEDQYRLQCCENFRIVNTDKIKDLYTAFSYPEQHIMIPKVIINNTEIQHSNGKSIYRGINISCERLPRQKLLDALDDCIKIANQRYSYITKYDTRNKKITYKKYCCDKEYSITMRALKLERKDINNCKCNQTENNQYYNILKSYQEEKIINYVYDIETENHHFAAGIGHMIVHNSMYGAMGVRRGYLPFMPGAMCTTYMGRTNIEVVAKTIPEKFGGELVYGDTDTCLATTPVLILKNDNKYYTTLENLSAGDWKKTVTGKEISSPKDGIKVWSDQGFTEIKYVMRHAIEKPMIKVTTHTGTIVCTLDHSLLWENGEPALGSEIKLKDKLCHRSLPLPDDTPKEPVYPNNLTAEKIREYIISNDVYEYLSAELAFVWGVFFADGSCGSYKSISSGLSNTWAINKKDQFLLERCMNILIYHEPTVDFKILDTMKSSHVNKLVAKQKSMKKEHKGTIKAFVEKYRELFYDNRKYKKVPDIVLNAPYSIREAFFMGYYAGDGSKKDPALTITNKGEIGSAGLFFLLRSIGYQVSINTRGDKPDTYKLTGSTPNQKFRYAPNAVKKIEPYEVEEDEYIYDIETSNHHFAAGVGQMVVHNSNYIHFPHLTGAQETWDHALYVASEVTKLFPKPIELEFEEEIYAFFFILSKKRYMYRKCLRDGIVDKKIGKKGVLLARRDNSKFIRDIYESVISKIADDVSRDDILYYVINEINEMCSGVKPVNDFIVTKSVGDSGGLMVEPFVNEKGIKKAKVGDYTVPILSIDKKEREEQLIKKGVNTEDEYYLSCLPAQVQLAERMRRRGQRVDAGTRLEYVVCDPDNHTGKQYEKLESAEYLIKHKEYINIDYMYYLKALINPLDQVLDVAYGDDNDYKKGFIDTQYKQRWKIRHKFMEQLKDLFRPNLIFKD